MNQDRATIKAGVQGIPNAPVQRTEHRFPAPLGAEDYLTCLNVEPRGIEVDTCTLSKVRPEAGEKGNMNLRSGCQSGVTEAAQYRRDEGVSIADNIRILQQAQWEPRPVVLLPKGTSMYRA